MHSLLFAAYAVLFLWSQNLGETDPRQVLLPLLAVVAGAALLTIVLGLAFHDRRRGALVASPVVVGFLMYGHLANNVSAFGVPGIVQQAGWVALVVVAVIAALQLDPRRLTSIDTALSRIAAILVLVTLALILPFQVSAVANRASIARVEPVSTTTLAPKRDVYWLVFDRFGSDESFETLYGVESDMNDWLAEQGFTVLEDSHANYIRTVLSMATTLQMAPLDEIARVQGASSEDLTTVNERLSDSLVARQFKGLGYTYHHIGSWWDPSRSDAAADVNHALPALPGAGDFADVLYDASAVPAIARRLGIPPASRLQRHHEHGRFGLDQLGALRDEPGPKFVLAHVLLPHPPFVFDRDGSFIDDDTAETIPYRDRVQRQVDYTNERLKEILSGLLALHEDQRPIIILQGDEGPWPTSYEDLRRSSTDWATAATDEELEEKFGILNAWYLPGEEDLGLYPSMTAINTFPVLFSRYFGIDYPLLPDRVYSSRDWLHPYDLTDITDRLPSLR